MNSVLITGGAGFIGSHLVDAYIANGCSVTVLDDLSTGKRSNINPAATFVEGDIRDKLLVPKLMADVDGCIHLAAVASVEKSCEEWQQTHTVNLSGMINVLEAAFPNKTPVVYASSAAVYGIPEQIPLNESSLVSPISPYGADKAGCELHANAAWHVKQTPARGMRFFNVYGPRQDPKSPYSGVISIFADRMISGQPVAIHGDGGQTRDFIYVADVVNALMAALETCTADHKVYAVCRGASVTVKQLAETIASITGYSKTIEHTDARLGDIRESLGNPSRMNQELEMIAATQLVEGLSRTIDHLKNTVWAAVLKINFPIQSNLTKEIKTPIIDQLQIGFIVGFNRLIDHHTDCFGTPAS